MRPVLGMASGTDKDFAAGFPCMDEWYELGCRRVSFRNVYISWLISTARQVSLCPILFNEPQ